jgi:excisionase family DNA binding protein
MGDDTTFQKMMTPGEVARLVRVDPKTVSRWARTGKLTAYHTPGGHHRFRAEDVRALLGEDAVDSDGADEAQAA